MLVKISCQTELHPNPKEGVGWDSYTAKIRQRLSLYQLLNNASIQLFDLGAIATEDMKLEYWPCLESSGDEGLRLRLLIEVCESPEIVALLEHLSRQGLHVIIRKG